MSTSIASPLPNKYYLSLVTSQYQNGAPNMLAWLLANLQLGHDVGACLASFQAAFALATAVGAQLDVLGSIIGITRTLPLQQAAQAAGGSSYVAGDVVTVVQGGASGRTLRVISTSGGVVTGLITLTPGVGYKQASGLATTGGSGTGLTVNISLVATLDDATYRVLLQCTAANNHFNGQISGGAVGSMQAHWRLTFPGTLLTIADHQDMTATVTVAGAFTPTLIDLITNGYIVPRPQAVLYNYVIAALPLFGFDAGTAFIAGFDAGKFN